MRLLVQYHLALVDKVKINFSQFSYSSSTALLLH